jgi:glyoxylase-like metal-dependent hydrolase (beta-lactamase superfamily II)
MSKSLPTVLLLGLLISNARSATQPNWCRHLPRPAYAKLERVDVPSDWFEVYRLRPGIFAISEPRQFEEVISYLIVGPARSLLFDTGMGIAKLNPLVRNLTSTPVIVLNSHTHPDHIGGNFEFNQIWGVETAFTKKNSKGISGPEVKSWIKPDKICGELPSEFQPNEYRIRPFRISHFIKDTEEIDLGGSRKIEIVFTPGHTPDSICLLDRENRVLFTGDTFYPGPLYLYAPETNLVKFTRSINRLVELQKNFDTLLTAHNVPEAPASVLSSLQEAIRRIQTGEVKAMEKDGLREYFFQSFSILLKK